MCNVPFHDIICELPHVLHSVRIKRVDSECDSRSLKRMDKERDRRSLKRVDSLCRVRNAHQPFGADDCDGRENVCPVIRVILRLP